MTSLLLWRALLTATVLPSASTASAPLDGSPGCPTVASDAAVSASSLWGPPGPRGMTRVVAVVRPFLGLVGNTWGAVSEARLEHYFGRPFMLGVEISPLALAVDTDRGAGVISHVRLHAAYATDFLAIGFGIGERLRRFGTSGLSLAPTLRLGTLDGLNVALAFVYTVARNPYTGSPTLGFSNLATTLAVPLTHRLAATLDTGLSLVDVWVFATLGLRQRLTGDGGAGSWFVTGAFGLAWVSDRTVCHFESPIPCSGSSALSYGPTVSAGLERRF